jgi:hypothetical protein
MSCITPPTPPAEPRTVAHQDRGKRGAEVGEAAVRGGTVVKSRR